MTSPSFPTPAVGGPGAAVSTDAVLTEVASMIIKILDGYGADDLGIGMETSFHDDLEMESIDLVTLAGMLTRTYGADVNLAEYLADKDLDEVIDLTIGDIVTYVVGCAGHLDRVGRVGRD
ncbi:MAG: acyl carrier protein [Actinomycetota bacterium]|nr:acyl carrier protein [Actinomycetota bacterium]